MMNLRTLAAAAVLVATLMPAHAQDAAKGAKPAAPDAAKAAKPAAAGPVATVNGVAIPAARAELLARTRTQRGEPDSPQLRNAVRDELINREVITQDANKTGLSKSPEFVIQMDLVRQEVLLQAYVREYFRKNPVSDADVQKEYDRVRGEMGDKEYKVRHILVEQEDQAKGLIAELKKGAKFDELAQKNSKDEGTKTRGGDLDWQSPGGLVKPFSDVMVKLEKGKVSETPVRTQFGWHVIQLDDVRPVQPPPLADVQAKILEGLRRQRFDLHMRELRAKAKVE
jgi:peptidyl-prolyl cis-trans isomerase C